MSKIFSVSLVKWELLLLLVPIYTFKTSSRMREQRIVGGYSAKGHLFPFRTEKLSFAAPMVLPLGGRVGRRQLNIISRVTLICSMAFLCLISIQ